MWPWTNPNVAVEHLKRKAVELCQAGNVRAAIKKYLKALKMCDRSGYDRARVATHICLGRCYIDLTDDTEAKRHLTAAYDASRKPGYEQFHLESADLLGELALRSRNSEEALRYFTEASELEEHTSRAGVKSESIVHRLRNPAALRPDEARVIVGVPPLSIFLRRVHWVLGLGNIAYAHYIGNAVDKGLDTLRETLRLLKALPEFNDSENMRAAYIYAAMHSPKQERLERGNVQRLIDSFDRLRSELEPAVSEIPTKPAEFAHSICERLAYERHHVAATLRQLDFPSPPREAP